MCMYMIASLLVLILMSDESSMLIRSPIDSPLLCVYVAVCCSKRVAGLACLSGSRFLLLMSDEVSQLVRSFSNSLLIPRRKRIRKSNLVLSRVEEVLDEWLLEQENYDVGLNLRAVALRWTAPTMPDIKELIAPAVSSLAYHFSRLDPRLNPGLRQLTDAQLELHSVRPCLYGCKLADRLAQENGKIMKLAFSKYRELVFYEKKWLQVASQVCVHCCLFQISEQKHIISE